MAHLMDAADVGVEFAEIGRKISNYAGSPHTISYFSVIYKLFRTQGKGKKLANRIYQEIISKEICQEAISKENLDNRTPPITHLEELHESMLSLLRDSTNLLKDQTFLWVAPTFIMNRQKKLTAQYTDISENSEDMIDALKAIKETEEKGAEDWEEVKSELGF